MHRFLCGALNTLHVVYITPWGDGILDWTGVFRKYSSERVSAALLLSCLIKRCLQTLAQCAPSCFADLKQRAKRFKELQLLLALKEGKSYHLEICFHQA
jgi:hypothetical protein